MKSSILRRTNGLWSINRSAALQTPGLDTVRAPAATSRVQLVGKAFYSVQRANSTRTSHKLPCNNIRFSNLARTVSPSPSLSSSPPPPTSPSPSPTRTMATSAAALIESAKKAAAYQAVADHLLPTATFVGIGSGSTVVYVVEAIAAKGPGFYADMTFVPTGSQSKGLIRAAGLRLCNLDERPVVDGVPVALDVAFDGADEVDEDLNLIKGGGACLFQEKLVAVAARKFIAVADSRKQSSRLCTKWKTIPIEVLPLAAPDVLSRLKAMGSPSPAVRSGLPSKAGECVTDNGMWIIDAPFPPLLLPKDLTAEVKGTGESGVWEIGKLAEELVKLPGVVEIGLFHGFNGVQSVSLGKEFQAQKPVAAYFGTPTGEVQVQTAA
ncbi:ribose 5-phosphate isomerase A domain-containing protein [Trichoderma novae-zelandiae]